MTVRTSKAGFNTLSGYGLNAFTDQELQAIHSGSLEVLRSTGIKVETPEALDIFEAAGAAVERKEKSRFWSPLRLEPKELVLLL